MSLILNSQSDSINTTSGTFSLGALSGAIVLPQGNTAAEPAVPIAGMLRYNTDNHSIEFWNGAIWTSGAGGGGLVGPNVTVNNAVAVWAGNNGGTLKQNSVLTPVTIDGSGNISGAAQINATTLNATGTNLTIQTTTSGNIILSAAPGGKIQIQNNFWPATPGTAGQAIITDNSGTLSFQTVLQGTNNLSDVSNPSLALTNLGGRKYKSVSALSSNAILDTSYSGRLVVINNPGIIITLPSIGSMADGAPIKFVSNFTSGSYTIRGFASDKINWNPNYSNAGSIIVNASDSPELVNYNSGTVWVVPDYQSRIKLNGPATYYVSTTGTNAITGGGSSNPWATIQYAIDYVNTRVDLCGQNVTIQVADGTYVENIVLLGPFTGVGHFSNTGVVIQGNLSNPANCVIAPPTNDVITVEGGCIFSIGGFTLNTALGSLINCGANSICYINGTMNFGPVGTTGPQLYTPFGGQIIVNANYTINSGTSGVHLNADLYGKIQVENRTVTMIGTPHFSQAFAYATDCGVIIAYNMTFIGSAIGPKYLIVSNGVVETAGAGTNYLPGSIAGVAATGGQYV